MALNAENLISTTAHPLGGEQLIYLFDNGYGASCINSSRIHAFPYAWEIAVLKEDSICYTSGLTEDVYVASTEEEAIEFLERIKAL